MKLYLVSVLITTLVAFKCKSVQNKEKNNFDIIELKIDTSCSLSLLYFLEGDYMYRVGTIDSCQNLSKKEYIKNYELLLERYFDKILVKKGKVLFETNFNITNDISFKQELISITNKKFNTNSTIVDESTDRFTILTK